MRGLTDDAELFPMTFAACGDGVILVVIHKTYKPGARTVLGEYRPEGLDSHDRAERDLYPNERGPIFPCLSRHCKLVPVPIPRLRLLPIAFLTGQDVREFT